MPNNEPEYDGRPIVPNGSKIVEATFDWDADDPEDIGGRAVVDSAIDYALAFDPAADLVRDLALLVKTLVTTLAESHDRDPRKMWQLTLEYFDQEVRAEAQAAHPAGGRPIGMADDLSGTLYEE